MSEVTSEATIAADAERVWQVLAEEFDRLDEWFTGARHTELVSAGPIGLGTVRLVRNGPMRVHEEIVVWEPGEQLAYTISGLGPGARDIRSDWTLHARPDGSTVAQVRTSWQMRGGVAGPLIRPVYAQLLAKAGRDLTRGLKRAVEERR